MGPSLTLVPARTPPVLVVLVLSGGKLSMCLHSGESIRPSGCCALAPVRQPSVTSRVLLSASVTSSSTLPRDPATATPSRRRTSSSVSPSPTDKRTRPILSLLRLYCIG